MEGYTKLINGYWATCGKRLERDWIEIELDKDGDIISPQGLVSQIEAEKLTPQKSECVRLLNETEMHVSNDPPYPGDTQTWIEYRAIIRTILKSDTLQDIPPKPFS